MDDRSRFSRSGKWACALVLLASWAAHADTPSPPEQPLTLQHSPPTAAEIFHVPPEMLETLRARVTARTTHVRDRWELLTDLFHRASGLQLEYIAQPTQTVSELYVTRRGNCLSFTLAFIALARAAGLEAWAREVPMPLVWTREQNLVYGTGHVNAGLHTGTQRMVVDFEPNHLLSRLLASPLRGRRISDERALAHFYNNRGAELLSAGQHQLALRYLEEAIAQDPTFTPAWNNLGVLHRRFNDLTAAEQALLSALEHESDNVSALFNITALYRHTGNLNAAAEYQQRIDSTHPNDPYYQFQIGQQYEDAGEFRNAERHYLRAVRLSSNDHHLHFALARVSYRTGNISRAERAFEQAASLSGQGEAHHRYQAKLEALRWQNATAN